MGLNAPLHKICLWVVVSSWKISWNQKRFSLNATFSCFSDHGVSNTIHKAWPVCADVGSGVLLGVDKFILDGYFKSTSHTLIPMELVSKVFLAEFWIYVIHCFDGIFSVASSSAVFNLNVDRTWSELFHLLETFF